MRGYNLGKMLRIARKRKNLTQARLAQLVGIEASSISKIECGHSLPSLELLRELVLALETSADFLLETEHNDQRHDAMVGMVEQYLTVRDAVDKLSPYFDIITKRNKRHEDSDL